MTSGRVYDNNPGALRLPDISKGSTHMRRSLIPLALGAALLCGASLATAPGAAAAAPPTQVTIARPVTVSGHAAPGYSVTTVKGADAVDCSFPESSPAAVQKNIVFCSPSAADAPACWRSATAHRVLCLPDARTKKLISYRTSGTVAHTTPPKHKAALDIRLTGGTVCGLRDGGAGTSLKQHPSWAAAYYCSGGRAIWAPPGSTGVDRTHKSWTVFIAKDDGTQKVKTAHVAQAWFVGTHV